MALLPTATRSTHVDLALTPPVEAAAAGSPLPAQQWVHDGRVVSYAIRRSARARWLGLTIRPETGLVVIVPASSRARPIEPFLRQQARWIFRHLDRLAASAAHIPRRWPYGPTLPYQGEEHRVLLRQAAGRSTVTRSEDRMLTVQMRAPGVEGARRVLRRWYVGEAQRACAERAEALSACVGIPYRRLRIRNQRRQWGSCSAKGHLHFNWRLIMAPPEVLDYVVLHELCHRRELNHSPRFWTLVSAHCPAYRDALAWLKTYGPYLTL